MDYNSLKQESVLKAIVDEHATYPSELRKPVLSRGILHKLCYLVDFGYYELYGTSMTGETYVHTRNGPVPIHFNKSVDNLITDGWISPNEDDSFVSNIIWNDRYEPYHHRKVDDSETRYDGLEDIAYHPLTELLPGEVEVIRHVVRRYGAFTARQLEPIVKDDPPWEASSEGQALDYELVFYRESAQKRISEEQGED